MTIQAEDKLRTHNNSTKTQRTISMTWYLSSEKKGEKKTRRQKYEEKSNICQNKINIFF